MKGVTLMLAVLAGPALANPPAAVQETARQYLGERVEQAGWKQTERGWYAVTVRNEAGNPAVFFITPKGEYLIAGAVIEAASGENIATRFAENTPQSDNDTLLADLADTRYLPQGRGDPVYVLVDPLCSFCHKAAERIHAGNFDYEFRWVLVGWQGPGAKRRAAHLLGQEDRRKAASALLAYMRGEEPIRIDEEAVSRGSEFLSRHEALARRHQLQGTPLFVYQTDDGARIHPGLGALNRLAGSPKDREEAP